MIMALLHLSNWTANDYNNFIKYFPHYGFQSQGKLFHCVATRSLKDYLRSRDNKVLQNYLNGLPNFICMQVSMVTV